MKKLLYVIRIIFGGLMFLCALVFVCMIIFGRQGGIIWKDYQTVLTVFSLTFLLLGIFIYPSRTKYCSCGRKYTSRSYQYIETLPEKSKVNGNVKKTPYRYKINIVNYCEHCDKEYKVSKNLYAGEVIEYIDKGSYEDQRIPYDIALEEFKKNKNNR